MASSYTGSRNLISSNDVIGQDSLGSGSDFAHTMGSQGSLSLGSSNVVLIAINDSDQAEAAVTWYIDHLHKPENTLLLVYIAEPPVIAAQHGLMVNSEAWSKQVNVVKKGAVHVEQRFVNLLHKMGVNGRIRAVFDTRPAEAIVSIAKEEKVKYIVTGTRGLGKLKRTLQGSTSDHVLHNCRCPIMICRFGKEKSGEAAAAAEAHS